MLENAKGMLQNRYYYLVHVKLTLLATEVVFLKSLNFPAKKEPSFSRHTWVQRTWSGCLGHRSLPLLLVKKIFSTRWDMSCKEDKKVRKQNVPWNLW
jgi:hypothetical protein